MNKYTGNNMAKGGVTLSTGKEVYSSSQIPDLTPVEIEELVKLPINMLQWLRVKEERHEILNEIQKITGHYEDIKESLAVTITNSEERTVPLKQLVLEIYNREKPRRRWIGFKEFILHYKKIILLSVIIITIIIFGLTGHIKDLITILLKLI